MSHETGEAFATRAILTVLINNLRGRKLLSDRDVMELYDETLEYMERVHAGMTQKFGSDSEQSEIMRFARASVQREIDRELSYPKREG